MSSRAISRSGRALAAFAAALALLHPAPGAAQHHGHAAPSDVAEWRMPPMDTTMPMMPGLEGRTPDVAPFLPGMGVDPGTLPHAVFRRVVELEDGDTLGLTAGLVRRTIKGRTHVMYGFNGQYPGPLIKVDQNATVVIDFRNEIDLPSTVHWHGVRLDNQFDGVPGLTQEAVQPGDSFVYRVHFRDPGIYWYHPHVQEEIQQDLGLYGNMLVEPPEDDYYNPVNHEEVVMLDDLLIDEVGLLPWGREAPTHALMGRFGNTLLINGEPEYALEVNRGEVVRFFVTNVANTRSFNITFDGAPMKLIASDVSRFEREARIRNIPIAPAERYVFEVRFPAPGRYAVTNRIQAIDHFLGEFYLHVDTLGFVTVGESPVAEDHGRSFERLRDHAAVQAEIETFRPHFDRAPDHELLLTVKLGAIHPTIAQMMTVDTFYVPPVEWNDGMPMMNWLSTGKEVTWVIRDIATGAENMDIVLRYREGDVVKLRVFNQARSFHPMQHPIHIHGQRFLVLEQDGVAASNLVWKDTVLIPVGSAVDLLVEMSNPGEWMAHCHIAEHLSAGMHMKFTVLPASAEAAGGA